MKVLDILFVTTHTPVDGLKHVPGDWNFNHKLQSVCRPKVYDNVNQIIYVNFISLRRYENWTGYLPSHK